MKHLGPNNYETAGRVCAKAVERANQAGSKISLLRLYKQYATLHGVRNDPTFKKFFRIGYNQIKKGESHE